MEVTGTIIKILPLQTGQGKNGEWRKQEFVVETSSQYPKKICMNIWGDKIDQFNLKEGEQVIASIELESREFNSRWYTDVKAWKIQKQTEASGSSPQDQSEPDVTTFYSEEEGDSLPF